MKLLHNNVFIILPTVHLLLITNPIIFDFLIAQSFDFLIT